MRVAVVQVGSRHDYALPRELHKHGLLSALITTGYSSGFFGSKFFSHRESKGLSKKKVRSANLFYLPFLFLMRKTDFLGLKSILFIIVSLSLQLHAIFSISVWRSNVIVGFNGTLWLLAIVFHKKVLILDQTMGARDKMREMHPELVSRFSILNKMREMMERSEWRHCDVILCASSFVMSTIPSQHHQKVKIIPYGIDTIKWLRKREKKSIEGECSFVFVGSLIKRKGVDLLINVIKKTRVNITFIGDGHYRSELNKLGIIALGNLSKSELRQKLSDYDVLVLPSRWEGSATVIYEATAAGLTVLCSKFSGGPKLGNILEIDPLDETTLMSQITAVANQRKYFAPDSQDISFVDNARYLNDLMKVVREYE